MACQEICQTQGNQEKFNSFNCECHWNMILKNLKVFSQNIQKNNFIISLILEFNLDFNIILIQEPFWLTIRSIPYTNNCEDAPLVGISNHSNWLMFARELESASNSPRVAIYINIRLLSLWFSLCKDIINHRDILLISFCNNNSLFWIMNIYFDSSHSVITLNL